MTTPTGMSSTTTMTCRSCHWLTRLYAAAYLILIAVTWRLWFSASDFPRIPAVNVHALPWIDRTLSTVLVVALATVGWIGLRRPATSQAARRLITAPQWTALIIAISAILLFLLNQHCGQVWAWHLSLALVIAIFSSSHRALPRLRGLTIGLYAWSAVSKLDMGFIRGHGLTLWQGQMLALQLDPQRLPQGWMTFGPAVMPLWELAAAILLATTRTRRCGLWMAAAMHVGLLLATGPLGLGHEPGVQIWNVLFLIQNVVLFARPAPLVADEVHRQQSLNANQAPWPDRFARAALGLALVPPALQPWNLWDVWPSWAVYSARGGWTTIFIHHDDVPKLPGSIQPLINEPPLLSDWHPVDIDRWSLAALHCPVYPQSRFRVGIARAISRWAPVRIELRSPPDRTTGESTVESFDLQSPQLPPELAKRFWLNTEAR
jgi:hypothetical protein